MSKRDRTARNRRRREDAAKRAEAAGMPGLAPIKGPAHPRDRRGTGTRPREDARLAALSARCHHLGLVPDTEGRKLASAPHLGSPLGWVMHRLCEPEEIARLWRVWQAWCSAERTYRLRIIARAEEPKGASVAMLPERVETPTGHTIDSRTSDERDRDAVAAWMRWQGFLGQLLRTDDATRLHQARRGDGPPLWVDREPTDTGAATLRALRKLADVVEGN